MKTFFVYILASRKNGTLYIGMTSNLVQRVYEHRNNLVDGFTKQYGVHRLVYYEMMATAKAAIVLEKQMKVWKRQWKINLIEKENPGWEDLYEGLF
ncbi:MAG: GIY-YIG nuclease family protein [Chloroflexota bacterium]